MARQWKTPRALEDPAERKRRRGRRTQARVNRLNRLVYDMRHDESIGPVDGKTIPYVDPDGGGADARALFLMQDPSNVAADDTGFISPDNSDPTADNFTWLRDQTDLDRRTCVHWNVVPWVIGKNRDAEDEALRARPWLEKFIDLLTELEVVVCMGDVARDSWNELYPTNRCQPGWLPASTLVRPVVLSCPHTSFHVIDGGHKNHLKDGLKPAERILATLNTVQAMVVK